jgi:23S rRNA pseudouridine1911/1915/1917 synthase
MSLTILYEDDAILFVDKPPGIVVQRSHDQTEPVLYEIAAAYTSPLFLMQRLDRGTSGVLFFTKRSDVNSKLTRQFEQKRIEKLYLAITEGRLAQRQTIDAPLLRIGAIKFGVRDGGKRAVTHVDPLSYTEAGSLVGVHLETGRTHQIRVHLAAIGHALAGDWLYGERDSGRPMLHSRVIEMTHPLTNQRLRVESPVPADFMEEAARRGLAIPVPSPQQDGAASPECS